MAHLVTQFRHRRTTQRTEDRAFFHDVLNTAAGIVGIAELLRAGDPTDVAEFATPLAQLANRLIEEIRSWQVLQAAASGDLAVISTPVDPLAVLNDLQAAFCDQEICTARTIVVAPEAAQVHRLALQTDGRILSVVLEQLLKAALATCPPAATVTLDCSPTPQGVKFTIHSPAAPINPPPRPSTGSSASSSASSSAGSSTSASASTSTSSSASSSTSASASASTSARAAQPGATENSALTRVRWLATHYLRANLACAANTSGSTYVLRCPAQLPQTG